MSPLTSHLPRSASPRGFTLLELVAVVLILALLAVLLIPVAEKVRGRLDATRCAANLRALHGAAALYVQEKGAWPQVAVDPAQPRKYAEEWIAALRPYGPEQRSWICPTVQRALRAPDLTQPENTRVDYVATPFDDKPQTPFQFGSQPWFAETADAHGQGNLLIFASGRVLTLSEFRAAPPQR